MQSCSANLASPYRPGCIKAALLLPPRFLYQCHLGFLCKCCFALEPCWFPQLLANSSSSVDEIHLFFGSMLKRLSVELCKFRSGNFFAFRELLDISLCFQRVRTSSATALERAAAGMPSRTTEASTKLTQMIYISIYYHWFENLTI